MQYLKTVKEMQVGKEGTKGNAMYQEQRWEKKRWITRLVPETSKYIGSGIRGP